MIQKNQMKRLKQLKFLCDLWRKDTLPGFIEEEETDFFNEMVADMINELLKEIFTAKRYEDHYKKVNQHLAQKESDGAQK